MVISGVVVCCVVEGVKELGRYSALTVVETGDVGSSFGEEVTMEYLWSIYNRIKKRDYF